MISSSAQTSELLTHPRAQQVLCIELMWKGAYAISLIFMAVLICSINFTTLTSIPITSLKNYSQCVELPFSPHYPVSSRNFFAFGVSPLSFSLLVSFLLPHPRNHVHVCSCCVLVHTWDIHILSHLDNFKDMDV